MKKNRINNDKSNELAITITSICRDLIQKGNVTGIYLNSFLDRKNQQNKIEIICVVDQITEEWKKIQDRRGEPTIYSNIHNLKVYFSNSFIMKKDDFTKCYMTRFEMMRAQELKNGYIVYDTEGREAYEDAKILTGLQKSFLSDQSLPRYKNHVEISPAILRRIKEGILSKEPIHLTNNVKHRIVNQFEYPVIQRVLQVKELLDQYHRYETKDGAPSWDFNDRTSYSEYIVCSNENLQLFKKSLEEPNIYYDYELGTVFDKMEKTKTKPVEEDQVPFFQSCLAFLEKDFIHGAMEYLSDEEKEIYLTLSNSSQKQKKITM